MNKKKVLITGVAGFIGFHVVTRLLKEGFYVIGIDSLNTYYDVTLKTSRLALHGIYIKHEQLNNLYNSETYSSYKFYQTNLENQQKIDEIFSYEKPDIVINLAAQAGVRYSITHPREYLKSNIDGFVNILENCRNLNIQHLIYASSSSVYGLNQSLPFSTNQSTEHPISLYAATKKSNELMAHTYSHLFQLPTTGLRFFTVYGPWGRPDMALFLFSKSIIEGTPIKLFNHGEMYRDFTYIDDITESIFRLINKIPITSTDKHLLNSPAASTAPYRIFNIGNNKPVKLCDLIALMENAYGRKAIIENYPMQDGDVESTHADINDLVSTIGYKPQISIEAGIAHFAEWYTDFYNINKEKFK